MQIQLQIKKLGLYPVRSVQKESDVGHTGQSLECRIYQHTGGKKRRGGNSKFRNGLLNDNAKNKIFYKITAVRSHPSRVRRLAHEKELIQKLKPSWNVQVEYQWWSNKSNEFKLAGSSETELE